MTPSLRQRMTHDLQLAGLSPRTQQAYVLAVRQLADHFHAPPDQLTEPQLRDYFLHLKNDRQFAAASLGIAYSGIKFFYSHTVPRDWPTLKRLRVPAEKRLPEVLSVDEVRQLLAAVRTPHNRIYFQTVYSLGLRLTEGGPEYLERFGATMPAAHRKVLRDIAACRTGELGMVLYRCADCGKEHAMGRSCGNRHCPSCQRDKAEAWLEDLTDRLLPCPYFLLTFTLPVGLREVARAHQRVVYAALFEASSAAPRALAADPKYVGTDRLGFFGVLHTGGRTLEYHPHVHYVVPGGGLSGDGGAWLPSRGDFLVPVKALSLLYRGKVRDLLGRAGLLEGVEPSVWQRDWVVHCQPAGDGRESLRYLAPYVFRVAIGDHRIVSCDEGHVTFTYRRVGSNRRRQMTLEATEFLRRFLQHVLPSGFQKVRHYGFLSPASGVAMELVRWLIALRAGLTYVLRSRRAEPAVAAAAAAAGCAACGGVLVRVGLVPARSPAVLDTS